MLHGTRIGLPLPTPSLAIEWSCKFYDLQAEDGERMCVLLAFLILRVASKSIQCELTVPLHVQLLGAGNQRECLVSSSTSLLFEKPQ